MFKTTTLVLTVLAFGFLTVACLNRQFFPGKATLISVSDSVMQGSSVVVGRVYRNEENPTPSGDAEVWIENSSPLKVSTNSNGFYKLNIPAGNYTIKCQGIDNPWNQLVTSYPIEIKDNKKIVLDFYLGYTVE